MNQPLLRTVLTGVVLLLLGSFACRRSGPAWRTLNTQQEPKPRGENAFVRVGDQFYLFGGRKKLSVDVYDPKTNAWKQVAPIPTEMHHFQAVAYGNEIYVLGAFAGDYPHETPVPRIYIYNPQQDQWRAGADIPEGRRRGSAGVAVHGDKIYLISGITDGHWDGHVTWLDEYDPKQNTWRVLPDAPRARDHFHAAVANGQLFIASGRRSTAKTGHVADLLVPEVDVYDFKQGTWQTLPTDQNIPTARGGCTAVPLGNRVVVIGGESSEKVYPQTEAYDFGTRTWHSLPDLQTPRHGTQALVHGKKIYLAAGIGKPGGSPELSSLEVLE